MMNLAKRVLGKTAAWRGAGLGVVVASLSTGFANAGDASCLWGKVPAGTRSAILAGYARRGADALADAPITNDLVRGWVRACTSRTPTDEQARAAGAALAGQALAEASAEELSARYGVVQSKLSKAWTGLRPDVRDVLVRQFNGSEPTPQQDAELYAMLHELALSLGWTEAAGSQPLSDPEFKAIADYFTGRAQAAAFSGRF